ncbi:MAG TPA: alpha/beta family hydrolase [Blastocatellia bacterium]|nr:alpha/beta family hydrolase [Blastocatellia bacterium]
MICAQMSERLRIKINEQDGVTALLYPANKKERAGVTLLLGHGAGANQTSEFMTAFASGLAARGVDAVTFNFLYTEQGRRAPDRNDKLEACYRAAIAAASGEGRLKSNRLMIGGKSLGGRIASQVAAEQASGLAGLVFLGYPLHPPGKPDQLRSEHLTKIRLPMLFVQGSRDPFGTPDELRPIIKKLKASLYAVEGGDHSLKVAKSQPVSQEQVYKAALDEIARWIKNQIE